MRYRVNGFEVRSENAAKPAAQASSVLSKWLREHVPTSDVMDFGCGRLRYSRILAQRAKRLTLVDSDDQISRVQLLDGVYSSVAAFAPKKWRNSRVLRWDEIGGDHGKYDFVLCANVLSAIPHRRVRSRVLRLLARSLKPTGRCLFVTQYRNSHFNAVARLPNAHAHLDGWLLVKGQTAFYYGIISKERLELLVQRHGHIVLNSWIAGQSAYVLTQRK